MAMVPAALAEHYTYDLRQRAQPYLLPNVIRWQRADEAGVVAFVRGTREYTVLVAAAPGTIQVACSCPYAAEHGACKHQWAVLVRLEQQDQLATVVQGAGDDPLVTFMSGALGAEAFEADGQAASGAASSANAPDWQVALLETSRRQRAEAGAPAPPRSASLPADRRLVYLLHLTEPPREPGLRVEVATQRRDRDGVWEEPKLFQFTAAAWFQAPDPVDRQIAEMLLGSAEAPGVTGMPASGFIVRPRAYGTTLRSICDTGRARLRSNRPSLDGRVVRWDDGEPWQVSVRMEHTTNGYQLVGDLHRDQTVRPLGDARWVHESGVVLFADQLARLDAQTVWPLVQRLWTAGEFDLGEDPSPFLAAYHELPNAPRLTLPPGEMQTEADAAPVPTLQVSRGPDLGRRSQAWLHLRFRYGAAFVESTATAPTCFDRSTRTLYRRRQAAERNAITKLRSLGAQELYSFTDRRMAMTVPVLALPRLLSTLVREGWAVEADGQSYVASGRLQVHVSSGIDWFDLEGSVRYGEHEVSLPQLLAAVKQGTDLLEFGDRQVGFLPQDSLDELRTLLAIGERRGDGIRFKASQLALLDVLLDALPEVNVDAHLERARAQLREFRGVATEPVPPGFVGTLRGYQCDGLSWFGFLRRFGLGGCLADDMGLGKTVQVLAMLEARRAEGKGMTLLVVPRSLVFNWVQEAARFTPQLRVLDLSHAERDIEAIDTADAHVVITTYGTLRRDITRLGARAFDYVVLDEAQAIKNTGTATAKAARLLQADHRLALTGTPIENRIEELWSLFEFLNPGMLGAATSFANATRALGVERATLPPTPGKPADDVLSRALRPVILRRTKAMVATELPPRTEQTLEVELEPKQRAYYDQLREQYVTSVFARVEREGMAKARMHILEALLRLRQAACHPALVDPARGTLPSAKLDAVVPALQEIASEGHKTLVFSQFTSFLALLRPRLDALGIPYEYLDGRTKDRQARVERFQSADGPPLFLISLKAGGHGLNLTAAEYVYLLDPWWNPAVEAQAIDRAHRIGQTQQVIATRVVARDTIESRILELQASKRALADAILSEDKGGLGGIGRTELELLLS